MKKLLLLLFLIPNLVIGEELDEYGIPLSAYITKTDKEPQKWLPEELNELGLPIAGYKTEEESKEVKRDRWRCATFAGEAKNEYSAKRIEATCLENYGITNHKVEITNHKEASGFSFPKIFSEHYSKLILIILGVFLTIFSFIRYKKIKDRLLLNEAIEAVKLSKSLTESGKDRTDQDMIPGGSGEFGLDPKNPIPTNNVKGSRLYLSKLKTTKGTKVTYERSGSTTTDNLPNVTDIYNIFSEGELYATIYICPYHIKNSTLAPKGLVLKKNK